MIKHIRNILLFGAVLLLAGCSSLSPTQAVAPTQVPQTPTIIIVVVTATAEPTQVPTATPMVTATTVPPTNTPLPPTATIVYPTKTPSAYDTNGNPLSAAGSLRITNIENNSGQAKISWTATGTNTNGFWIYYSTSFQNPYFGGYPMFKITDGSARTAYVDGNAGVTYYYRICHYTGSGCDYYSNSYTYTFPGATPTP
jgi:hypothetical protein